jgi:hypothetical protein
MSALPPARGETGDRTHVGFDIFRAPDWAHLEILLIEKDRNPFYWDFLRWIDRWSEGQVQIPLFEN